MRLKVDERASRGAGDASPDAPPGLWPRWAVVLASVAIALHLAAILSAEFATPPASPLQRGFNRVFLRHLNFTNNNYSHRFYARLDRSTDAVNPSRWGTPILTAELRGLASGVETLRWPDREIRLPLRRQRHLALAHHLAAEPRWGASYARHLAAKWKCDIVRLYTLEHTIPDLTAARRAIDEGQPLDLESGSFYSGPVLIGEFRWGEF